MEPGKTELKSGETINDKLRAVMPPLQSLIDKQIPEEDGRLLELDDRYHQVKSVYSGYGRFSFDASIEPDGFYVELPQKPTAVIKNIRIPDKLRRQGLGSKIVGVWEKGLSEQGIGIFAATNIQDKRAIEFWRKLGYQIPQGQAHKPIPYCMYKEIPATPIQ